MGDGLQVENLEQLRKLGEAYKDGDKALQKRMRDTLGRSAKDLSAVVIREGSAKEPARGGLRARLAAARGGVTVSLASRKVSVSIRAKTREGYALRQIDRGFVRHPVWGRWVAGMPAQRVPEHAFSDVFEAGRPKVTAQLRLAMQQAADDIAREAT